MKSNVRSRAPWMFVPLVLALVGCQHDITGPKPSIASPVAPHLVCNQQLVTRVTVDGSGFSPLPLDTATQPAHLALPAIMLTRSTDLAGAAAASGAVTIPDDPLHPEISQVHWTSASVMAFDVTPGLLPDVGIYGMTITNRNGNTTTRDAVLAVIPPPTLSEVRPMAICDAQHDVVLELFGTGFLVVHDTAGDHVPIVTLTSGGTTFSYPATVDPASCTALPAPAAEASLCTHLTITVSQDMVPVGTYAVTVTNPDPAGCHTSEAIDVEVVPPPTLVSTMPARLCSGGGTLSLSGMDFRSGATVTLGGAGVSPMQASMVTVAAGGQTATAVFGPGLLPTAPGSKDDLTLTNPEGCSSTLPSAVTIVDGPLLYFADPPVIYDGLTIQVTLYASGLTGTPTSVSLLPTTGAAIPLTQFSVDSKGRLRAVVPAGTPVGTYTVVVDDPAGCAATLPNGLRITDTLDASITSLDPSFAWNTQYTSVAVNGSGAGGAAFTGGERLYIQPHGAPSGTTATALRAVSKFDDHRLTALIPPGLAAGPYDVILVTSDGHVAVDTNGLTVTSAAPPVIDTATPGQVLTGAVRSITVTGSGFANPTATWSCQSWPAGMSATPAATVMSPTTTSLTVTMDATAVPASGNNAWACVLRLTNPDGSYGDYSVVSVAGTAGNISNFTDGRGTSTARRAPAVAVGSATRSARFLYVMGGDDGTDTGALSTEELVSIDEYGQMGPAFAPQPYGLPAALSRASAQRLGRYLYLVGGMTAAGSPTSTVYRSEILDPLDSPQVSDVTAARKGANPEPGLGAGLWYYRVSSVYANGDVRNPGGESLASDPVPVQLPQGLPDQLFLTLEWAHDPRAVAYDVYASPTPNADPSSLVLVGTVNDTGSGTQSFVDKGVRPSGPTQSPLPLGAHGKWYALASLAHARASAAVAIGVDPSSPSVHYVYAMGGREGAATFRNDYEYLALTDAASGPPTPAVSWTAGGAFTTKGRWELSGAAVTPIESAVLAGGTTWIYAGAGRDATGAVGYIEAGTISAGGALTNLTVVGTTGLQTYSGYAWTIVNNNVYQFFGAKTAATSTAVSAGLCGNTGITCMPAGVNVPPNTTTFNSLATSITGTQTRYLPGSAVENGFIYVVGGVDAAGTALSTTTLDLL